MKYLAMFILSLLIVGCTPNIKDRDFDKEEKEYIKTHGVNAKDPLWQAPTKNLVEGGRSDDVIINIFRINDIREGELALQQWKVFLTNKNDEPKCVQVVWQLQDFQLYTDFPDFLLIKPKEIVHDYARMTQQIYEIDGLKLILPPSGKVANMDVRDPNEKGLCIFEADVEEM
jgi:hypothetical protein